QTACDPGLDARPRRLADIGKVSPQNEIETAARVTAIGVDEAVHVRKPEPAGGAKIAKRIIAPRPLSFLRLDVEILLCRTAETLAQPAPDIGPEFVPQVPGQTAEHAVRAAERRLSRRSHARRQPRVFDDVIEDVAGKSSPRRLEPTIGT